MASTRTRYSRGDNIVAFMTKGRHVGLDAASSLRRATAKFEQRFQYIESTLSSSGATLENTSMERLNMLWNQSKAQ